MPELPEVETMVRDLSREVLGRRITRIVAPFEGSVIWPLYNQFDERVRGQEIVTISRRGKYAVFTLGSSDALIVHRGMSGSLLLRHSTDPMESHVRLLFELDNDLQLRFNDPRKFGKVFVMQANGHERPLPWAAMGPEPLHEAFTVRTLQRALQGRKGLLKPLLLNQRLVAGLGNIYVDEALYRARLHPERRAHTLKPAEIKRLHGAIQAVLAEAIEQRGTTFSSYTDIAGRAGLYKDSLQVFQRVGAECLRCRTAIIRLVVGGRGTHVCPKCQKA